MVFTEYLVEYFDLRLEKWKRNIKKRNFFPLEKKKGKIVLTPPKKFSVRSIFLKPESVYELFHLKMLLRLVEEKQDHSCEKVEFFVGKDHVF